MRYFNYLDTYDDIFYKPPKDFSRDEDKEILSYALGATLYVPAVNGKISDYIIKREIEGLISMVICLEDAIGDGQVKEAENNLIKHIKNIKDQLKNKKINYNEIPLLFIRVRDPLHLKRIMSLLSEDIHLITGFVFPKFSSKIGERFLDELEKVKSKKLYAMPILETKEILYKETRYDELNKIKKILSKHKEKILNIRVGATDFCSNFGIRRPYNKTIYDISVINECLLDILNYFTRIEEDYVISGPVWEYFSSMENRVSSKFVKGLIKEAYMDKINGFIGKTIIHPSHIRAVQTNLVVKKEEYLDAINIIENNNGGKGVFKSAYGNKMNEVKPHLNWAYKILKRAHIYGVFHGEEHYEKLFERQI